MLAATAKEEMANSVSINRGCLSSRATSRLMIDSISQTVTAGLDDDVQI